MDPLSIAYKGEGSGDARSLGESSFDPVQGSKESYGKILDAQIKKKEKLEKDLGELADINLEGMDIDIEREFQNDKKMLLNTVSDMYKDGIDPFNPMNEDAYFKVRQLKNNLERKVGISKQQEKLNKDFLKTIYSKDFKENYNYEKSIDNYKKWREASVAERAKMNPSDILIQAPKSFDINNYVKDNFKLIEELESSGESQTVNKDGVTVKNSWKKRTPEALRSAASSLIDGSRELRNSALANYNSLSDSEKGKYNGLDDYFYKNHLSQYVKKDTEYSEKPSGRSSSSFGFGGSKIPENFLEQRRKNIETIIKAFTKTGSFEPTKEALQLLPTLTSKDDSIIDAKYDWENGFGSSPTLIIKRKVGTVKDQEGDVSDDIKTIKIDLSKPEAYFAINELLNSNKEGVKNIVPLELLQEFNKQKGYSTDFTDLYTPESLVTDLNKFTNKKYDNSSSDTQDSTPSWFNNVNKK